MAGSNRWISCRATAGHGRTSVVAGLATASLALLAACSSNGTPKPAPDSGVTITSTSVAPVASAAAKTPSPTPSPRPTMKELMLAWEVKLGSRISTIGNDVADLVRTDTTHDQNAMTTACTHLKQDTASLHAAPPAPDKQLRSLIATANGHMARAADACLAGNIDTAVAEETAGDNGFGSVTARIDALTGPNVG